MQNDNHNVSHNQNPHSLFGQLMFSDLPMEQKFRIVAGIGPWVHSEFLLRVIQSLSPEHIEKLVGIVEHGQYTEDMLLEFLKTSIPNIDTLLDESVMAVRANLIAQKNFMPQSV